jgi:hypothetical protein
MPTFSLRSTRLSTVILARRKTLSIAAFIGLFYTCEVPAGIIDTIEVPFTWAVSQTTGPNKSNATSSFRNDGPSSNEEGDSDSLAGTFTIGADHSPPAGYTRVDPLPDSIFFKVDGALSGSYADSTINATIGGVGFEGWVRVDATLSVTGVTFPAFVGIDDLSPTASGVINELKSSAPFSVSVGSMIPYSGTINGKSKFGFGGQNRDFQAVFAQLLVSGGFVGDTSTNITYEKVPEPASAAILLLGLTSMVAVRRRRTQTSEDREVKTNDLNA